MCKSFAFASSACTLTWPCVQLKAEKKAAAEVEIASTSGSEEETEETEEEEEEEEEEESSDAGDPSGEQPTRMVY